jgi:hypothetical protein
LALLFGNRVEVRHLIFVHFQGIGVMTTVNMTNRHCLSELLQMGQCWIGVDVGVLSPASPPLWLRVGFPPLSGKDSIVDVVV